MKRVSAKSETRRQSPFAYWHWALRNSTPICIEGRFRSELLRSNRSSCGRSGDQGGNCMWAGIGLLRRSVIAGITLLCLMLSLLIVVNAGGATNSEASLETVGRVKTSKNDAATSGSSEKTASDGDISSVNGQSQPSVNGQTQSGGGGSQPSGPDGVASNNPSAANPGQSSSGQQQSGPGSPGTSPPTTRPPSTSPPTTSPPTTIACPTNGPSASGAITSFWQPPFNPNLPSSSQEYYVSGSVVVTNAANRTVDVVLSGNLKTPLNEWGRQFDPGTVTVGPNSSSTVGFSDIHVRANSSSDIWVSVNVSSFSFQC